MGKNGARIHTTYFWTGSTCRLHLALISEGGVLREHTAFIATTTAKRKDNELQT